jgi:hypothetical protein
MKKLTLFQELMLDLGVKLTSGQDSKNLPENLPETFQDWLQGSKAIWYFQDGGDSRIIWNTETQQLSMITNNPEVKDKWDAMPPQRMVFENYLAGEWKRMRWCISFRLVRPQLVSTGATPPTHKLPERRFDSLTALERVNLEQAAAGCISAALKEWPLVLSALKKVGCDVYPFTLAMDAREMAKLALELEQKTAKLHKIYLACLGASTWAAEPLPGNIAILKIVEILGDKP